MPNQKTAKAKMIEAKLVESYDLSGKTHIVFQEVDHLKQAEELEKQRQEIALLINSLNHSRLYSRKKRISFLILCKLMLEAFKKRSVTIP